MCPLAVVCKYVYVCFTRVGASYLEWVTLLYPFFAAILFLITTVAFKCHACPTLQVTLTQMRELSQRINHPHCYLKQSFVVSSYICWHQSALKNKCDAMLNIKISLLWPKRKTQGQSFPACFCVAVSITADYSQITSTCGQWKLLQSLPQYHMRWLCLAENQQRKRGVHGEEVKGRAPLNNGEWGVLAKSSFWKHHVSLEFIFQILSNWKQMLRSRPHENIKHSCCFPNHQQKGAGSDEEAKEWVSKENYQVQLWLHSKKKNALRQTLQDVCLF